MEIAIEQNGARAAFFPGAGIRTRKIRTLDYSKEPTTLVVFELADAADGTLLTVVESGFDGDSVDAAHGSVSRQRAGLDAADGGDRELCRPSGAIGLARRLRFCGAGR